MSRKSGCPPRERSRFAGVRTSGSATSKFSGFGRASRVIYHNIRDRD